MRIILSDLSGRRGGRILFRHVSCEAGPGACLKLTGPNGAGKTSMLRIIAGFLPPEAGAVRFEDADGVRQDGEARAACCGWMGSRDALAATADLQTQLTLHARLCGQGPERVEAILRRCGLATQARSAGRYLSAGQRRRFSLARLMLSRRPVWLMDEPLALLDAGGRNTILAAMTEHCAAGGVIVTAGQDDIPLPGPTLEFGGTP